MDKFLAIMQLLLAALLAVMAAVTIHNLFNIATRPETISVVNTLIGQGVVIVCLSALATVLFRKGWKKLKQAGGPSQEPDSSGQ